MTARPVLAEASVYSGAKLMSGRPILMVAAFLTGATR
jgi:hypothetical protein